MDCPKNGVDQKWCVEVLRSPVLLRNQVEGFGGPPAAAVVHANTNYMYIPKTRHRSALALGMQESAP